VSPDNDITAHCREIDRCNQRGGRMLSLIDLLRAKTVDLDLAAYLATAVRRGASFLVGANPGGAGKTTVMGALLNFVPADCRLHAADSGATLRDALDSPAGRQHCYICHEIGSGPYYAYLWGAEARDFFALPRVGHIIATNLHADTLEECREQVCGDNGVAEEDFQRCRLCLFLALPGGGWHDRRRRMATVWESDGESPHRLVWRWDAERDAFRQVSDSRIVEPDDFECEDMRQLIEAMVAENVCTIDAVRRRFVESLGE
jgi:hypothetical protein